MRNVSILFLLLFFFFQCAKNNEDSQAVSEENVTTTLENDSYDNEEVNNDLDEQDAEEEPYPDGTYSATVDYYNPDTGTSSTYTLDVEVENGELTVIHWPNGGWLDSSHFTPEDITSGSCSFTSDEGNEYTVTLD